MIKPVLSVQRASIFFRGRYRKYSRRISQSPWSYDDDIDSVESLVTRPVVELLNCGKGFGRDPPTAEWNPTKCGKEAHLYAKFHAAGREDVDVRMLGRGRPFIIEIKDSFYPAREALNRIKAALSQKKKDWSVSFNFVEVDDEMKSNG